MSCICQQTGRKANVIQSLLNTPVTKLMKTNSATNAPVRWKTASLDMESVGERDSFGFVYLISVKTTSEISFNGGEMWMLQLTTAKRRLFESAKNMAVTHRL